MTDWTAFYSSGTYVPNKLGGNHHTACSSQSSKRHVSGFISQTPPTGGVANPLWLTLDVEKQKAVFSFSALSALMSMRCWYLFLFLVDLESKLWKGRGPSSSPHPPYALLSLIPRKLPVAMWRSRNGWPHPTKPPPNLERRERERGDTSLRPTQTWQFIHPLLVGPRGQPS